MGELKVRGTAIPGLLVVDLTVHGDSRGWFKENWQRSAMTAAGLPDFGPVQHSLAYNASAGVTRGIHAEPWDKLVSVAHGRIFGAWVDLRPGDTFGVLHTEELDEHTAVFVPRGVGNSYQALVDDVVYSYLVNDHWSPHADYTMLNLADESVAVPWPIPLTQAHLSDKDRAHPRLAQVAPMAPAQTLVLGAGGQLGQSLLALLPGARAVGRGELDLADSASIHSFDFSGVGTVINAAADTAVDAAETPEGRRRAWAVNATGVAALSRAAIKHGFTLVHYSSDYVFDGEEYGDDLSAGTPQGYGEDAPLAPLGVYGQSKAAGDLAVSVVPRHYLLRTSWVVGDGQNFVRTMARLADQGVRPTVVADQTGRLTFTADLAAATLHLLDSRAAFGTYHVTSGGDPTTWADLARAVFEHRGRSTDDVTDTSTADYAAQHGALLAPRPAGSVLNLSKVMATGYSPPDQLARLSTYLDGLEQL
ncbi:MAG: bifunctional dTDP-4-dehydrorhamnose 3,5-epimerase family protein/NAD(P)-dependent oxidoreductase [Ornithinimicrobium sp.]|uniref:bifunctional dTDP-4-dehydrorhamnose 3,5-epimerase family protein/NAD(P)-dependent oxidoreductase n=1 Tax=Ornithinimicrobium sp. TaxID=1977084 RepID=UPI0026E04242|nr:bifunctional dTDP-4-dehydrorhamnose 3,5-epimerase family protein/NAD(P)-dependent oxidoreductase [Ornithinimicrobium sp.]MDO5740149.1 bifunctional dTDP-4-dehydrorhamnose 3,5-epimerase family protein/NAD(P)-dependent oxidoreductase [Ornithinimicrobium sp.]